MHSSIAWSILVRNEMWVAKVLLHINLQNFWESWFFSASYSFRGSWKPQKWAIFEMRSSIAWSILVGNEVWVAKIFLHTYFQVFWVRHVASDMLFHGGHEFPRAKPKFWKIRLYYLTNTSQIWAVSSHDFSSDVLPEFRKHTCCFQVSFSSIQKPFLSLGNNDPRFLKILYFSATARPMTLVYSRIWCPWYVHWIPE